MYRSRSPRRWKIEGLPAAGPARGLKGKLRLFGQFVGDWEIVELRFPRARRTSRPLTGEVHFNWILGGRAIQDVWGHHDPRTGRFVPWGTTVRYYSPALKAWRSTWIAPGQKYVRRFVGRRVGSEIVLREEPRGLRTEWWIFSHIRPDSFEWRAVQRRRRRGPWETVETMRIERRGHGPSGTGYSGQS
jgi:hypothetical protein